MTTVFDKVFASYKSQIKNESKVEKWLLWPIVFQNKAK